MLSHHHQRLVSKVAVVATVGGDGDFPSKNPFESVRDSDGETVVKPKVQVESHSWPKAEQPQLISLTP